MEYTFKIVKELDKNNNESYFVFDSFNTCLGIFTNIFLACDLIHAYLKNLTKIHSSSSFGNVEKQLKEISNYKTELTPIKEYELDFITEITYSKIKSLEKNKEKFLPTGNCEFSTTAITLSKEIKLVFDEVNIDKVHWLFLKENVLKKLQADNESLGKIKTDLALYLSEKELSLYFSSLFTKIDITKEHKLKKNSK